MFQASRIIQTITIYRVWQFLSNVLNYINEKKRQLKTEFHKLFCTWIILDEVILPIQKFYLLIISKDKGDVRDLFENNWVTVLNQNGKN